MTIKLPLPRTDPLRLADWLELTALSETAQIASGADLEQALKREGLLPDAIEQLVAAAFLEIEARVTAGGQAYPFVFDAPEVRPRPAEGHASYLFCLCLSYEKWTEPTPDGRFPRRLFEDLAVRAARNYIQGEGFRFGSPRNAIEIPAEFLAAVGEMCARLEEGQQGRQSRALSSRDDSLDVVAWRHFIDRRLGKLILFGQCASGHDWRSKLTDLQPLDFCKYWTSPPPASPLLKAFFVPHRIDPDEWDYANTYGGIVFDRCRLALWAEATPEDETDLVGWYTAAIPQLKVA